MKKNQNFALIITALTVVLLFSCKNPGNSTPPGEGSSPTYIGTKTPDDEKTMGDILFNDGSATSVSQDLSLSDDQISKIAGIIVFVNDDGKSGLIAGVKYASNIAFAKNTPIYDLKPILSEFVSGNFTGDIDGSDNLEYIQSVDSKATTDLATYYPALNYACNYGTNNNMEGAYETGWYLPAQKELYDILQNFQIIENARVSAGQTGFSFISGTGNSTPGSNTSISNQNFLSSNVQLWQNSDKTRKSYDNQSIQIKYNSTKKTYSVETSLHDIQKGNYTETSGGGSNGYTYKDSFSYVMAVHKF